MGTIHAAAATGPVVVARHGDADGFRAVVGRSDFEHVQLFPGQLELRTLKASLPQTGLDAGRTNLPLRGRGHYPADRWTIGVCAAGPTPTWLWGRRCEPGDVGLVPPGQENDSRLAAGFQFIVLTVDPDLMRRAFAAIGGPGAAPPPIPVIYPAAAVGGQELLRRFLEAASRIHRDPSLLQTAATASAIEDALLDAAVRGVVAATEERSPRVSHRVRNADQVVRMAEEFVRSRPGERASLRDVCQACGVGSRALHYAFEETLGTSPGAYFRLRRLQAVREDLRRSAAEPGLVREVARRWGFWHLGEFAAAFRDVFGELPSEAVGRAQ